MEIREAKKQKSSDDSFQYFKDFLENKNSIVNTLKEFLPPFKPGKGFITRPYGVFFLRVKSSNATANEPFSRATVATEEHHLETSTPIPVTAQLTDFFLLGYDTLERFLNRAEVPKDLGKRQALRELLQFLSALEGDREQTVFSMSEDCKPESKAVLAIRFAQHLLVPLVSHKRFIIDASPSLPAARCCSEEHELSGEKGDTSFGCPGGWHGRADILLQDEEVPFTIVEDQDDDAVDAISVSSDSLNEEKNAEHFSKESLAQINAQAIVNSFLHQRKKPSSKCALVPGIGLSSKQFIIYLYDCVDDVLLSSWPIDLYARFLGFSGLSLRAVIILWLTLNHSLFSNTTPERFSSYTAGLHDLLGSKGLEAYQKESEQPFKTISTEYDEMKKFHESEIKSIANENFPDFGNEFEKLY